ncbi:MAG: flavin reductase family protein [Thermoleophilaceae bacterium]
MTALSYEVDATSLRAACARFPTGVIVVTACDADGDPIGMAVNSFTSVSLDPPLVLVCAGRTSETWPAIRAAGDCVLNVLAEGQAKLALRFACKDDDRFASVTYSTAPSGAPLLEGAIAWLECSLELEVPAGDHVVALAAVRRTTVGTECEPLVFHDRRYGGFRAHEGALR